MDLAVRGTIWAALVLFAVGEAGRRLARTHGRPVSWALPAFASGALLCALHFMAVFQWHHGWSHERAMAATALQTTALFGFGWGGGVWFNYVFLAVWIGDAIAWAREPSSAAHPPSRATWIRRAFYALIIVNAAVVFVPWPMQLLGLAMCAALAWAWRR